MMKTTTPYANRFAAALSAFALSLVMISGTVSVPAKAQSTAIASAYVGVVA